MVRVNEVWTGKVKPEDFEHSSEIIVKVCSSSERLYTFLQLRNGMSAKHIAQDLDVTRSALQFYINDWKELELIYTEGRNYEFTDVGATVSDGLLELCEDVEEMA